MCISRISRISLIFNNGGVEKYSPYGDQLTTNRQVLIKENDVFFFSLAGQENGECKGTLSSRQTFNISNEVFEEDELSSRTVSEDKISTITEVSGFFKISNRFSN